jgi:hypothetical protein
MFKMGAAFPGTGRHNSGMNNEVPVIGALENAGYEVLKGGWPDLLAAKDGGLRFIEIKGPGDKLSAKQARLHKLLLSIGIKVEVVTPRLYYGSEGTRLLNAPDICSDEH